MPGKKRNSTLDSYFGISPAKKAKPPEEEKSTAANAGHKCGFQDVWKSGRSWLKFDREKQAMSCTLCKKHKIRGQNGPLTWADGGGCKTLRLDKVSEHENSKYHAEAVMLEAESIRRPLRLENNVAEVVSEAVASVVAALKLLYLLIKRHVPHTTNYEAFVELCIELGCDELKAMQVGENAKYTSEQILQEYIKVMSDQIERDVIAEVKNSPAFAVMVDESTDIAVVKQLVLFGRALVNGKNKTRFLKITDINDGKADTIVSAIRQYLSEHSIEENCLTGFGSDGANVMTGKRNGVAKKLKDLKYVDIHEYQDMQITNHEY